MEKEKVEYLKGIAKQIRLNILELVMVAQPGHLGGSMSCADIMAVLYFHKMKFNPKNLKDKDRDIFVMSKGHSVLAQYAAFMLHGIIGPDEVKNIKKIGAVLQGHPDTTKTPGIEANTGSLGQGLSIALGIALAKRLDRINNKVYCLIGDGETDEGQIWEALNAASFHKADNLAIIVDANKLKASGRLIEEFDTGNLSAKATAFGAKVIDIDGHDVEQIAYALDYADTVKDRPVMIMAHTVKGKGVSFAENKQPFHIATLSDGQYRTAIEDIKRGI